MKCSWREGNKIELLENGEQYYPAVFKAIGEAQERIILETFICGTVNMCIIRTRGMDVQSA